jgi:hypothetical protein
MSLKQWRVTLYLLLIAMTLGAVLVLGAVVAPVIFHSDSFLASALLDNYNEGALMAEIFYRFTYWGYVVVLAVVFFEVTEFKQMRRDRIAGIGAMGVVGTLLLFNAVYTPKILQMHSEGPEATQTEAFASLHTASEIDFQILAVALAVLFIRRMQLMFVKQ